MRIRRWASAFFICCYLSCLAWGVSAHALKVGLAGNTFSYFFVWDMFCGWQAYDNRTHIVAEDADGNHFEVKEPWGSFTPFGNVDRINYDVSSSLIARHIKHVLDHSSHPPIDRVYVVQEIWPKQFNAPDHLWSKFFHEPKDRVSYYNLRSICSANGAPVESYMDWFDIQSMQAIMDNPRLQQASAEANPYYNTFFTPGANRAAQSAFTNDDGLRTN